MRLTNFSVQNKLILEILFIPQNEPEKRFRCCFQNTIARNRSGLNSCDLTDFEECYGFGESIKEAVDNYADKIKGGIIKTTSANITSNIHSGQKFYVPDILKGSQK